MKKQNQAITLIALVITIVIIVILAAISINMVIGDNGIFTMAQTAKTDFEISGVKERMELAKVSTYLNENASLVMESYFDQLVVEDIIDNKTESVVEQEDGTYQVTTKEDMLFDVWIENGDIKIEYAGEKNNQIPKIFSINLNNKTTNTVDIEVKATRLQNPQYEYYYKEQNQEDYQFIQSSNMNTYRLTKLTQNVTYDIKVKIISGEYEIEKTTYVTMNGIPEGTISFNNLNWSNRKANVTIQSTTNEFYLQYKTNSQEWQTIENGKVLSNLNYNDKITARLWDGDNASTEQTYTVPEQRKLVLIDHGPVYATGTTVENVSVFNGWVCFLRHDMPKGNYAINDDSITGGGFINFKNVNLQNIDVLYLNGGGFYDETFYIEDANTNQTMATIPLTTSSQNVWYQKETTAKLAEGTYNLRLKGNIEGDGIIYLEKIYVYYKN